MDLNCSSTGTLNYIPRLNFAELTFNGVISQRLSGSFIGLQNAHVIYLARACHIRSTGFVYGGPFLEPLCRITES